MTYADLNDHPFSRQAIEARCGFGPRELSWLKFYDECILLLGHDLNGCDDFTARANGVGCGYSIDEAYLAFEASDSAAQYVARVKKRDRYDHGAFVSA